jgi:parallel beta-helix repeat protein
MSRRICISLPLLLILMCALGAAASDIYFAPNAAGANNGTSCANAYAYNDGAHGWNQSAQQAPGNNLHVCSGTYTFAAGATIISAVNAGTSSSPITWIADQGAVMMQAPYFSGSGAIAAGNSYWVFNGANNLTAENTLNGTAGAACVGGPCSFQQSSYFVRVSANNVTIENMQLLHTYVHVPNNPSGDSCCSTLYGIYSLGNNNVTISGNTLSGNRVALTVWGSNLVISHNTMTDNSAAWWFGSGSATSNVLFHDNSMTNVANWMNGGFHLEFVHLFTFSGAVTGAQIYNNYFGDDGANCCGTAKLYHEGSSNGEMIFNNFFVSNDGVSYLPGIEFETETSGGGFSHVNPTIVNNTFSGGAVLTAGNTDFFYDTGVSGLTWQNNVALGGKTIVSFGSPGYASGGANYNLYENTSADMGATPFGSPCGGSGCATLPAWQAALPSGSGQDLASVFDTMASLKISASTGSLSTGSLAIGAGTNLTSLGIAALNTGAPETFGAGGSCGTGCLARPASGAWDIGAFPFSAATSSGPNPPTGLTAAVN